MAVNPTNARVGQVLGGRYQLGDVIGKGGQSTVYRGRDLTQGDEIAIKVMSDEVAKDADYRERMLREAFAMASLAGTSALRVMDQVWTEDHRLCLIVELLHGEEFEDHLLALFAGGQVVAVPRLVEILEPIVSTLEVAHDRGIIHRDLKPGNIFLLDPALRGTPAYGSGVRLLDFGFAKFERMRSFTAAGMIAGSKSYIAPEAWKGLKVDNRIDVYALGAIVFRCLTGQPPFFADDLGELLRQVTMAPRPSLLALRPDLPQQLDDWMAQILAIEPIDRFFRVKGAWNAFRGIVG